MSLMALVLSTDGATPDIDVLNLSHCKFFLKKITFWLLDGEIIIA